MSVCDGTRGNHGDPLVTCPACENTPLTDEVDQAYTERQWPEDTDEYIVTYKHLGKRLNTIHWESKDDGVNRRHALEHAARAAESMDVSDVQVARRPRTQWEPINWKSELGLANSAGAPYDGHRETSAADA